MLKKRPLLVYPTFITISQKFCYKQTIDVKSYHKPVFNNVMLELKLHSYVLIEGYSTEHEKNYFIVYKTRLNTHRHTHTQLNSCNDHLLKNSSVFFTF